MDAPVSARLRPRHPAFPDKLDRLDLELSAELPSLHDHLRLDKTPNLGVHQTGSSSVPRLLAPGGTSAVFLKSCTGVSWIPPALTRLPDFGPKLHTEVEALLAHFGAD